MGYILFLVFFSILFIGVCIIFNIIQIENTNTFYIKHNEAIAYSLLKQNITK